MHKDTPAQKESYVAPSVTILGTMAELTLGCDGGSKSYSGRSDGVCYTS